MKLLRSAVAAALLLVVSPYLASSAEKKSTSKGDSLEKTLIAKEKQKWDAFKKKDVNAVAAFYADDFLSVGYGASGVVRSTKAETIQAVPYTDLSGYTLKDFQLVRFDEDCAALTYKAVGKYPIFATSVWVNRDGKWLTAFYQSTAGQ